MPRGNSFPNSSFSRAVGPFITGGSVYWVDSTATNASDGNDGLSRDYPKATLDGAVNACTANNGDLIILCENHAETLEADSDVDIDVAGITVIGLGTGTDRPTFTFATATTADFKIAADNTRVTNCLFLSNIASLAMMIEVTGDYAEIDHCEFREGSASMENAISIGTADGEGDYTHIHHCRFYMDEPSITNNGDAAISVDVDVDNVTIEDNWIYGDFDEAGISVPAGGNASDFLVIRRNYVENTVSGNHAVEVTTGGTMNGGAIVDNILVAPDPAAILESHTLYTAGNKGVTGESIVLGEVGGMPVGPTSIGSILYVDSNNGSDSSDGRSPDGALATIDAAINLCNADEGSIIYVLPSHTEAVSAATTIVPDTAGISIIGIGVGADRPTITVSTADTANIPISASNVVFKNFVFDCTGFDSITAMITITAADVTIEGCEFIMADACGQADSVITTNSARTKVLNCVFRGSGDAGVQDAIEITGTPDGCVIKGNTIWGDFSNAGIQSASAHTNAVVEDNFVRNLNSGNHAIQFSAAATGVIQRNTLVSDGITTAIDPGSCILRDNKWQDGDLTDVKAINIPAGGVGPLEWQIATRSIADASSTHTTAASPVTEFTVTGMVAVAAVFLEVDTGFTSTCSTGTLECGVTGSTALLCSQDTVDGTAFAANDVWCGAADNPGVAAINSGAPVIINGDGTNIITTVATNNMTAGAGTLYCIWAPISQGALVVGA